MFLLLPGIELFGRPTHSIVAIPTELSRLVPTQYYNIISSRALVTIDGVWIGYWIYGPLTGRNYK
jgi:hypothetical protein